MATEWVVPILMRRGLQRLKMRLKGPIDPSRGPIDHVWCPIGPYWGPYLGGRQKVNITIGRRASQNRNSARNGGLDEADHIHKAHQKIGPDGPDLLVCFMDVISLI